MTDTRPLVVLLDGANRAIHYAQLREQLDARFVVEHRPLEAGLRPEQIDLAVVSDEFHSLITHELVRLRQRGVPTLHVVDGILEWRNTWENPRSATAAAGLPLFQPVLSDKIACLGRAQARILQSWGNLGKCEVVGAPRLDHLLGRTRRQRPDGAAVRLLAMTARTAGFTATQVDHCCQSLRDLSSAIRRFNSLSTTVQIEPVWRVASEVQQRLGGEWAGSGDEGATLADTLATVDAVVTTPSTAMLEAMLQGVPVALLDYHNCPHYVPAAWTITAPDHVPGVLAELLEPPVAKLLWQDTILHDNLECRTPATPRLVKLAQAMIARGRAGRRDQKPADFSQPMLGPDGTASGCSSCGPHLPEERYDLQQLYPHHAVFSRMGAVEAQAALGHAHRRIHCLQMELETALDAHRYYWKYTLTGRIHRLLTKLRHKVHLWRESC